MSRQLSPLKLCRFAAGLLQPVVAKRAQIGCMRLAEIENGRSQPRPDELERLAVVLGVSQDDLLGPDATAQPAPPLQLARAL